MAMMDLWRSRRQPLQRPTSESGLFSELTRMQREMDEMFDRLFGGRGVALGERNGAFAPALDVMDHGNEVLLRADLPGLEQKDVRIELSDGNLTIRGERKNEQQGHDDRYDWVERWQGAFVRTIALPSGVQADKIEAQFKNGVLEIHMPKRQDAAARRIDIKTGDAQTAQGQTAQGQPAHGQPAQRQSGQSQSGQSQSGHGSSSRG
jgi:HSP20 family protein